MIKKFKLFFEEHFHKKRFFLVLRCILLLFLILFLINFGRLTLSKYNSEAEIKISPELAFFITDVGSYQNSIALDKIVPNSEPYFYKFTVSNYKDNKRINVNLDYEIEFITTTNLPLNFKVYKNETDIETSTNIISKDQIKANDDNVYFRIMGTDKTSGFTYNSNQTDTYILRVEFPENYKYSPDLYEGVIDLIEIKVNAKQKI